VIGSFSPFLNDAMVDYVTRARDHLNVGEYLQAAHLLNDTSESIAAHHETPELSLSDEHTQEQHAQVAFHAEQILALRPESYVDKLVNIKSRIKFVNGELDEYTTTQDILTLARYVTNVQFVSVPNTGHFLETRRANPKRRHARRTARFLPHWPGWRSSARARQPFFRVCANVCEFRYEPGSRERNMTIYHSFAILLPWAAWLAFWTKARPGPSRPSSGSAAFAYVAVHPLIVGCVLVVWPDPSASWNSADVSFDVRQWLGLAVVVAGLLFSVWGRRHLGSNWSVSVTLKDGHELVRSGPYALVRHPIYSGCLLP